MTITLTQARTLVDGVLNDAHQRSLKPLAIAVCDPRTTLVLCLCETGVSQLRDRIAIGKARGAVQLGMGTRALMARVEQQAYFVTTVNSLVGGDCVPLPGGVLIRDAKGELLGAVGVSGDTSDNDELVALAGIAAIGLVPETG